MSARLNELLSKQTNALLEKIRAEIAALCGDDRQFLHLCRRRIFTRLERDERGNPADRRRLKRKKWRQQNGKCAMCHGDMPERESELDRFNAVAGYTIENTQLLHHECHRRQQIDRGFR